MSGFETCHFGASTVSAVLQDSSLMKCHCFNSRSSLFSGESRIHKIHQELLTSCTSENSCRPS